MSFVKVLIAIKPLNKLLNLMRYPVMCEKVIITQFFLITVAYPIKISCFIEECLLGARWEKMTNKKLLECVSFNLSLSIVLFIMINNREKLVFFYKTFLALYLTLFHWIFLIFNSLLFLFFIIIFTTKKLIQV